MSAQTAATVPIGALRVTIAGGSASARSLTAFAIPLNDVWAASGAGSGRIAAMTSDTLTIANAGWTAGALATQRAPYIARVVSGSAAGKVFSVTANTTDTLTVTPGGLTALGIAAGAAGDRVEIVPLDTLQSLFGSDILIGGTSATTADIVYVGTTTQDGYYFNTTHRQWRRALGRDGQDCSDTPLPPGGTIHISRIGAAVTLTFVGRVPATPVSLDVANSGNTHTHTGFPTPVTVREFALQSRIAGWSSSDKLLVRTGGRWLSLRHNGANWVDAVDGSTVHDETVIPAGSAIVISRSGTAAGTSEVSRPLPYAL